ncbi:uncharacterized protein B0J16DRAFT_416409 [Fusarium flagelliforme]|uniref:uncharacterized protein n=1 Tax=Fusarium flagelliforme TaxID=2675880 RepID=UPI001E8DA100|nr:uncharacterized protein B0J16DRAFT_416409 [Fusarium flagelliforme]KAH7183325.1 hypothetical protein B0J16DRAFT_416409 [Fusarium flagelliforme]
MSGVELLAGIGILCNAMQIVTFGKDALEVYNHVRENGTADPRLETYLADASISYQEMRKQLSASGPLTSDQQEIVTIGEEAHNGLEKIRTYFQQLYVDENSRKGLRGRLRVAKSGVKTLFRAKELEDLEKNFERYHQLFQTRLIQKVCGQEDAAALLTQECFTHLNTIQQTMLKKIAEGHTEMSLLVSQKAVEVKDHVTDQHGKTRTAMGSHLSTTENRLRSHISESTSVVQQEITSRHNTEDEIKRYDQLMASLRYPEMNSRKNQVIENFPDTFRWTFSSEGPWVENRLWGYSSGEDSVRVDVSDDESQSDYRDHFQGDYLVDEAKRETPGADRHKNEGTGSTFGHDSTASAESFRDDSTEFTRWLGSESKMFWISGKPGSGKSTLMKFIATSSETQEHLATWRSDTRILSHYFWKAGSTLERSLKGLFLSLTHQLLLDKVALGQQLLETMPDIRHKWSYADWDLQELRSALLWMLDKSGNSFLLLMDGLDESEEFKSHISLGPRSLNILEGLSKLQDVKVCFSSREEHVFNCSFEGVETLRVHELTKYDIQKLANSRLKSLNFANPGDRKRILYLIVEAASGVFLWVVLVVDSVTRAFFIDNSMERLVERINHMPTDVLGLVRDMWGRSGEDGHVLGYRASASRYFNLALANDGGHLSILTLTLASKEHDLESMLDPNRTWDKEELSSICSKTRKELSVVCHGLLEVESTFSDRAHQVQDSLTIYEELKYRFTHRCAIDFLQDTDSGSALLDACEWRQGEAKARLIGARMICYRLYTPGFQKSCIQLYDEVLDGRRYTLISYLGNFMEFVLKEITRRTIPAPYHNLFLRTSYEWYMAGLFHDCNSWGCSGRSIFREDAVRNGFLASMAKAACSSCTVKLLDALPTQEFLNALPAIFRGVFIGIMPTRLWFVDSNSCLSKRAKLTKQALTRLLVLQNDGCRGDMHIKASTGESREDMQRLVCSWFLSSIDTDIYNKHDQDVEESVLSALYLIKLSLPGPEYWDQPVLLSIRFQDAAARGFMHFHTSEFSYYDCFSVGSLATVYQLFLCFVRRITVEAQSAKVTAVLDEKMFDPPNGSKPSLRIVILQHKAGCYTVGPDYQHKKEKQVEASELILNSLITGRNLTKDDLAFLYGLKGDGIAHDPRATNTLMVRMAGGGCPGANPS